MSPPPQVLNAVEDRKVRIPHNEQVVNGVQATMVGNVNHFNADETTTLFGHSINTEKSPNRDMKIARKCMSSAAGRTK